MTESWDHLLPSEYCNRVVQSNAYRQYTDDYANAEKIIGFDDNGERCFYYHAFTITEEGFDIDEFPILIDAYYECVVAWRLREGKWVRVKTVSNRLDRCHSRYTTLPAELVDTP
ncbi:hypothetical protein MTYP_00199 [Methylophilaceae bacterium]|nr:hypothetical protein MTYP_00199 [Methylophilaceae bacterium]